MNPRFRMEAPMRNGVMRNFRARTGVTPARARTRLTPIARRYVLLPDILEPLTIMSWRVRPKEGVVAHAADLLRSADGPALPPPSARERKPAAVPVKKGPADVRRSIPPGPKTPPSPPERSHAMAPPSAQIAPATIRWRRRIAFPTSGGGKRAPRKYSPPKSATHTGAPDGWIAWEAATLPSHWHAASSIRRKRSL